MSLREPVELLDPSAVGPVYFIAIGGAGMSGVARIYHDLGVEVRGSDQVDSANLRDLASLGVQTWVGHDPSHLAGLVPWSSPRLFVLTTPSWSRHTGWVCGSGIARLLWRHSCSAGKASQSLVRTARQRQPAWLPPCSIVPELTRPMSLALHWLPRACPPILVGRSIRGGG